MTRRRVVITGIEVIAPGGIGKEKFWNLLSEGRTATRGITFFDPTPFRSRVAAEIDFDPYAHGLTAQEVRRLDRTAQFAVVASRGAVADSGIELGGIDPHRIGVTVGSAVGATMSLDEEYRAVSDGGRLDLVDHTYAVPHLYNHMVPSSFASEVAWAVGAEGPSTVVSTGCTSGLDSVGYAVELVREGSADVVIAGSSDAPISPITMACFDAIKATSPDNDDAEHASRPFDANRNGFVMGEGAAVLVLEEYEHARARGAHIYCEIGGYATYGNAYHMTGLTSEGLEMSRAIDSTLDQARIDPTRIDYVNAHGSGTRQNDRHETAAVKRSLGEHAYRTPMSSIKSMVGHSLGAIGAIEVVACVLALKHQVVPPTANYETPDPECDLDYVPRTARPRKLRNVLSVGSGFGGFQSAVLLTGPAGRTP